MTVLYSLFFALCASYEKASNNMANFSFGYMDENPCSEFENIINEIYNARVTEIMSLPYIGEES